MSAVGCQIQSLSFCTIVSQSHLSYAVALARSLESHGLAEPLTVLVVDALEVSLGTAKDMPLMRIITPRTLRLSQELDTIRQRFELSDNVDQYRWSLKPLLLSHLLVESLLGVVYVDCDIHFFGGFEALGDAMDCASVVLTPHWHYHRPGIRNRDLDVTLAHGYFNAGLIGVTPRGKEFLEWWARACAYKCEKAVDRGLYDDQRYLDVAPHLFPHTRILEHQGYNVAQWNLRMCERVLGPDSSVMINRKWPVVCVHFYRETVDCIQSGRDPLLRPYLRRYRAEVEVAKELVDSCVVVKALSMPASLGRKQKTLPLYRKALRLAGAWAVTAGRKVYVWATPRGYE